MNNAPPSRQRQSCCHRRRARKRDARHLPAFADTPLFGTITSASGEKMGGVVVSAKAEGSTITMSVYTDEAGRLLLPAAAGRQLPGLGAGHQVRDRTQQRVGRQGAAPGLRR